jgi:hypothetical protein
MTNDWPEGQQPRESGTLAAALAKAQAEMSNPGFDSQNPHFRSRFASLASVRNAVVPVLAKHGIALTQDILTTESGISCTTTLSHGSGQQMVFGPLVLPAAQTTAQGFGSAATYARRYQLMAVAAVAGDDDDAEAAVGHNHHQREEDPKRELEAKLLASNFKAAFDMKDDAKIAEVHDQANSDQELYQLAWKLLDAPTRRSIKLSIDRVKHGNGVTQ